MWEPLLEGVTCRTGASLQGFFTSEGPRISEVSVSSPKPCNINLSSPMCELLSTSVLTLLDDVTGGARMQEPAAADGATDGARSKARFVPYSLENCTGMEVRYGRARAGSPAAVLVPDERQEFDLWPEQRSRRQELCGPGGPPLCYICLGADGWSPIDEVQISRVGRRPIEIHPTGGGSCRAQRLICEVSLDRDVKRVALHSTTSLINETTKLLDVRVWQPSREIESVHPLPPGERLPLPLRPDGGGYRLCLRPAGSASGAASYEWSEPLSAPGDDGAPVAPAATALVCGPPAGSAPWHAILRHAGRAATGVCELRVQPTFELRNLLSGALRLELRGSNVAVARTLRSGELVRTHAFAPRSTVSLSVQIAGYEPSERVVVCIPPGYADDVLSKEVPLRDAARNTLHVEIAYERAAGCLHSLALHAPYVEMWGGLRISARLTYGGGHLPNLAGTGS